MRVRRFWISAALTLPVVFLAMSEMIPRRPVQRALGGSIPAIELALATPVVLWGGWPLFQRGWASVARRHSSMFTLIAIGAGAAYLYSVVAALFPGVFPNSMCYAHEIPVDFEAAAVITTLALLGQVLELRARERTGGTIGAPLGLAPETARRVAERGGEEDVVAAYFVPAVLAVSATMFVAWLVVGPEPSLTDALVNAVAVLIAACPCAVSLVIRRNLRFALLCNALGVPIAARVLSPIFGLLPSLMIASAAMSLSSIFVIQSALRLRMAAR